MKTTTRVYVAVVAAAVTWSIGLHAQESEPPSGELQEIVVTAEKRAENVDKVPISIDVFNLSEMDRQGVRDIEDIYQMTPGVDFNIRGPESYLSIRGISSTVGAATVGVYVDDIPIQTRILEENIEGTETPKVFDLDRIEILRGPQGTYFGAGAEAGAIRFITPTPSLTENSGYARTGFNGTDNGGLGYEGGVAVGGPIVDDELGYRVSYWHERVGGYIDHYSTVPDGYRQADSNWSDTDAAKAALLFQPNEHVKITPQIFFQNVFTEDNSSFDPSLSDPSTNTFVKGGLLGTPDKNQIVLPELKMEFDMGGVSLTSISGFLYREESNIDDYSLILPQELGLPPPTSAVDYTAVPYQTLQKNISQEIRLQNTDPHAKLKWVVGTYYSLARQDEAENVLEPDLNNYLLENGRQGILQTFGCCGPTGLLPGGYSSLEDDGDHDRQIAAFGQIDYEILPHLTLTVGARRAKETSAFTLFDQGALTRGNVYSSGSEEDYFTTPKYGISYQLDDKNLLYATASKGNRLGGANAPFFDIPGCLAELTLLGLPAHPLGYGPDYVWNYELGSKNLLFNDRVQIEMSVFHMKWSALQQPISVQACASDITANVGDATSDGFDLQIRANPTEHVQLGLAAGYDRAIIGETTGIPGGAIFASKGDQIDPTHSPWDITGQFEYDFKIWDAQPAYIRADDEYHSKNPGPFNFQDPNSVAYSPTKVANDAQNLINLRLGTLLHNWDAALFVTNLANDHPILGACAKTNLCPIGFDYTLPSRTVGAQGTFHW